MLYGFLMAKEVDSRILYVEDSSRILGNYENESELGRFVVVYCPICSY